MLIGPVLGQWTFMRSDSTSMTRKVALSWLAHGLFAAGVVWLVLQSPMPLWAYLIAAYVGLSVLKIRTFLEHRAHEKSRERSVIVEGRGPLALLFLNNNLHAVHHMHPQVAWYDLPATYSDQKDRFLACNGGYVFTSYNSVFARYLLKAKDPVVHPLWHTAEEKLDA